MPQTTEGSVRVVARFRPPQGDEPDDLSARLRVNVREGRVAVLDRPPAASRSFAFDRIYPSDTPQEGLMEEVAPLVRHALAGRHATVFAYGQTGSGKTHTVDGVIHREKGNPKTPMTMTCGEMRHAGIIFRAIDYMFRRVTELESEDGNLLYELSCSYYQLYNDRITDLLKLSSTRSSISSCSSTSSLSAGLRICSRGKKYFQVKDLSIYQCKTREEMQSAFFSGASEKIMGRNAINRQSSRSHTVFTIYVGCLRQKLGDVKKSEFTVVDLAGSEKVFMSDSRQPQTSLREVIEINTSLLALKKVISALSARSKKDNESSALENSQHIPYRDSKLTMLLKHALGGNSLTTMIACINPSSLYIAETVSTLLYAGRARKIVQIPESMPDKKSFVIRQLLEEKANLLRELEYYRNMAAGNQYSLLSMSDMWFTSDESMRDDE